MRRATERDALPCRPDAPGGVAEWLKATVLKTVGRKPRGFESHPLRQSRWCVCATPDAFRPARLCMPLPSCAARINEWWSPDRQRTTLIRSRPERTERPAGTAEPDDRPRLSLSQRPSRYRTTTGLPRTATSPPSWAAIHPPRSSATATPTTGPPTCGPPSATATRGSRPVHTRVTVAMPCVSRSARSDDACHDGAVAFVACHPSGSTRPMRPRVFRSDLSNGHPRNVRVRFRRPDGLVGLHPSSLTHESTARRAGERRTRGRLAPERSCDDHLRIRPGGDGAGRDGPAEMPDVATTTGRCYDDRTLPRRLTGLPRPA